MAWLRSGQASQVFLCLGDMTAVAAPGLQGILIRILDNIIMKILRVP